MQFLKILFWCLIAFVAALFTYGNWQPVPIHLWAGLEALVNLPLLLFVTFLVGVGPIHFYHSIMRWRLRQRLAATEQTLAETRMLIVAPLVPVMSPVPRAPLAQTIPPIPEPEVPPLPGELT